MKEEKSYRTVVEFKGKLAGPEYGKPRPFATLNARPHLAPHGRNVLVEPEVKGEEVSTGGIVIAQTEKPAFDELVKGVVRAVGKGGLSQEGWASKEEGEYAKPDPSLVGKTVFYKKVNANTVPFDGKAFDIIDCEELVAVEV
jgi:co-chaperonin GroES (HSP10)